MVSKKGAKGIISGVAFFNGFSMEYGFSPWERLAVELWSSNLNAWAEPVLSELFVIIQIGTVIFTFAEYFIGIDENVGIRETPRCSCIPNCVCRWNVDSLHTDFRDTITSLC